MVQVSQPGLLGSGHGACDDSSTNPVWAAGRGPVVSWTTCRDPGSKLVDDAHELNVTICGSATCAGIALQDPSFVVLIEVATAMLCCGATAGVPEEFLSEVAPFTISSAHVSGLGRMEFHLLLFRCKCANAGGSGPLRLLKRTCKPQHVFCDLNAALAGLGAKQGQTC